MKRRIHPLVWLAIASIVITLIGVGKQSSRQPVTAKDDIDMAVRLAMLDGVEPSEAGEYVAWMDDLETLCYEDRDLIGGISKGISDVLIEGNYEGVTQLEGMKQLHFTAESWNNGQPVKCLDVLTFYRNSITAE